MAATAEDAGPLNLSSSLKAKEKELQRLAIPSAWSILDVLTILQLKKRCRDLHVYVKSAANKPELIEALLRQATELDTVWRTVFSGVKCWEAKNLVGYCERLDLPTTGGEADLQRRLLEYDKTYISNMLELKALGLSGGVNHPRNMAVERRRMVAAMLLLLMKNAADNDARDVKKAPGMSAAPLHAFKEAVAGVVAHALQFHELWDELINVEGSPLLDITRAWLDCVGSRPADAAPPAARDASLKPLELVAIPLLYLAIEAHTFDTFRQLPGVPRLLAWGLLRFLASGEGHEGIKNLILSLPRDDLARVKDSLEKIALGERTDRGLLFKDSRNAEKVEKLEVALAELVTSMNQALIQPAGEASKSTAMTISLPAWFSTMPEKFFSTDAPLAWTALRYLTLDQLNILAAAKGIRGLSRRKKPEVAQTLLVKEAVKVPEVWEALPQTLRSQEKLSGYCTWHGLDGKGSEAELMKRLVDLETESFRKLSLLLEFKTKRPDQAPKKEEIAHLVLSLLQAAFDTDQKCATGDMHASKSHTVKFYGLTDLLALPGLAQHYAADKKFEPVLVCWMQLTLGEGDGDLEMVRFLLARLAKDDKPLRARLERFLVFCQLMALEEGFEGNNADIPKALGKYQMYASEDVAMLKEVLSESTASTDISQVLDRIEHKVLDCLIKARESKTAKRKPGQEPENTGKVPAKKVLKREEASSQDIQPKVKAAAGQPAVGKAPAKKSAENAYLHKEPLVEVQEPYPILLGCYNFKGGVGKTTIAINLGVALRNAGHRTCYVDCDSQCNMTKYFNTGAEAREARAPNNLQADDVGDDTSAPNLSRASRRPRLGSYILPDGFLADLNVNVCRNGSFDRNGNAYECTIKEILQSSFRGQSLRGTPGILEFAARRDGNDESMYPDMPDGLFLIPGHQDLGSSLESRFSQARGNIHNIGQEDAFMVLGGFRKALTEIAKEHRIKYMVCDFGPSKGVANEVLLASLDMIIPPFMPDFFSASSVAGLLETVMPGIIDMKATVRNREVAARLCIDYAPFAFFNLPTKLLPFLMTNIKVQGPAGNQQIVRDHAVFFNLVERLMQEDGMEIRRDVRALFLRDSDDRMVVPFLKQVTVLFTAAQAIGHPAIALTHDMVSRWYSGNVPPGIMAELRHTAEAFQRLARMVITVSRRQ
eukprot:jgi/Mesvir1/22626/Mv14065-RA.2